MTLPYRDEKSFDLFGRRPTRSSRPVQQRALGTRQPCLWGFAGRPCGPPCNSVEPGGLIVELKSFRRLVDFVEPKPKASIEVLFPSNPGGLFLASGASANDDMLINVSRNRLKC